MREIKFRQWLSMKKRMEYGAGIVKDGHWRGPVSVNFSDDPLMQFTGLRDKNGREVFENDIVRVGHNVNTCGVNGEGFTFDGGFKEYTGTISMNYFGVWLGDEETIADLLPYMEGNIDDPIQEIEVIGNIHENPELVK